MPGLLSLEYPWKRCPLRGRNLSWARLAWIVGFLSASGDCKELMEFPRHKGDAPYVWFPVHRGCSIISIQVTRHCAQGSMGGAACGCCLLLLGRLWRWKWLWPWVVQLACAATHSLWRLGCWVMPSHGSKCMFLSNSESRQSVPLDLFGGR